MKLGILGTGKIVQELMKGYRHLHIEKTYLLATDRSRERGEDLVRTYGLDGVFTDYDALLAADIDTVYVALPNDLHYAFTRKALLSGKDVILEKPATSNVSELETLLALSQETGRILLEAMTVHHLPVFSQLREALPQIGPVRLANLQFCQYSSRYTDFLNGITHPVFDVSKSGGALYDLNVYNVHAALTLFGKPNTLQYSANIQKGVDTSGILVLDYGHYKVTCMAAKDCSGPNVSTIHGEWGVLRTEEPLSRVTGFSLQINGGEEIWHRTEDHDRMLTEFQSILSILRRKDLPRIRHLQQISLDAARIMEQARLQAGIHFPSDRP